MSCSAQMGIEQTDEDLLTAARTGDAAPLEALILKHQSRLYRFSLKMCGSPSDAQDVLQETLIAFARSIQNFRGESSVTTWLYTVARSFCIKRRRKSKFAPAHTESLDCRVASLIPDPALMPDESLSAREMEDALGAALAALSDEHREVVVLRDSEGLTAAEVADVLGISIDAVKSRLHRARLALRDSLKPVIGETAGSKSAGCPDVLTTYSKYLEGEIDADLCRQMEQHLVGCQHCTAACDSLKRTLAICSTSPVKVVPLPVRAAVSEALRQARADLP